MVGLHLRHRKQPRSCEAAAREEACCKNGEEGAIVLFGSILQSIRRRYINRPRPRSARRFGGIYGVLAIDAFARRFGLAEDLPKVSGTGRQRLDLSVNIRTAAL